MTARIDKPGAAAVAGGSVTLQGIGVSPGVVVGPAYVMAEESAYVPWRKITVDEIHTEIARLEGALIETRRQICAIQEDLAKRTVMADAGILDAHLMVLDDPTFLKDVVDGLKRDRLNVESVVRAVADRYAEVLGALDDPYLRERVIDMKDVARRIIRNLMGAVVSSPSDLPSRHIIIAADLTPSETAVFRREMVGGMATDYGSMTSHTALMARGLQIPAVVGLQDACRRVVTGDQVLIDGNKGLLIVRPTTEQIERCSRVAEERRIIERDLRSSLRDVPAETKDGHRIILSANTESPDEIEDIRNFGAEGIGLFRSEYLYLASGPSLNEDEQTAIYSRVARELAPAPVIIRTFDVGGDKFSAEVPSHKELNPFLGFRSIRMSLQHPEVFKVQLRAILRASAVGNVKVMYPMVSSVEELIEANQILEEAKRELAVKRVAFQQDIDVGVMIEIPSAALIADALAGHVKFFSLGTNDLIQYTLAVDRMNERVAYLYRPTHPAVLKMIKMTIDAGHRHGIWVGLCGEMAGDPVMTPLLLGLGVDELSVVPSAVPLVKDAVRSVTYVRAKELAELALSCELAEDVLGHCRRLLREAAPELLELI